MPVSDYFLEKIGCSRREWDRRKSNDLIEGQDYSVLELVYRNSTKRFTKETNTCCGTGELTALPTDKQEIFKIVCSGLAAQDPYREENFIQGHSSLIYFSNNQEKKVVLEELGFQCVSEFINKNTGKRIYVMFLVP